MKTRFALTLSIGLFLLCTVFPHAARAAQAGFDCDNFDETTISTVCGTNLNQSALFDDKFDLTVGKAGDGANFRQCIEANTCLIGRAQNFKTQGDDETGKAKAKADTSVASLSGPKDQVKASDQYDSSATNYNNAATAYASCSKSAGFGATGLKSLSDKIQASKTQIQAQRSSTQAQHEMQNLNDNLTKLLGIWNHKKPVKDDNDFELNDWFASVSQKGVPSFRKKASDCTTYSVAANNGSQTAVDSANKLRTAAGDSTTAPAAPSDDSNRAKKMNTATTPTSLRSKLTATNTADIATLDAKPSAPVVDSDAQAKADALTKQKAADDALAQQKLAEDNAKAAREANSNIKAQPQQSWLSQNKGWVIGAGVVGAGAGIAGGLVQSSGEKSDAKKAQEAKTQNYQACFAALSKTQESVSVDDCKNWKPSS